MEGKRAILITGIAGVGKSTLARKFQELGHEAYDIEDVGGLFNIYKKGTKEVFTEYDLTNPEDIANSEWNCDIVKLKDLLQNQKTEAAFYCGNANNIDEIIPLFDKVLLLKASPEKLNERLQNREGKEDEMGNTEEVRKHILIWKDRWEEGREKRGMIVVKADAETEEVAQQILNEL